MAIAEALKENTTLTSLESAALPLNPLAHALRPDSTHARCTGPCQPPSPCAQPQQQQPRPRGWHGDRRGPQGKYDPQDARVCCPAIEPTRPCVKVLNSPPRFRVLPPLPLSLEASQHRPARALHATRHSLRGSRMSPARAQPTHSLHIHRARCLLAAAPTPSPLPPTPAHPAWTAATPSFARGWVACARAPSRLHLCPSQPEVQRPIRRRRHHAGPQSGRRQWPQAEALASGRGAFDTPPGSTEAVRGMVEAPCLWSSGDMI